MLHKINAYKITFTNARGTFSYYEYTKKTAENSLKNMEFWNPTMEETIAEVYLTPAIKKEFQKLIKSIRESEFNTSTGCEYPKAIMTAGMMERGEATIIFTWQGSFLDEKTKEYTKARAEKMMKVKTFTDFLNREEATAQIELKENNNYQIRIKF